MIFWSIIYTNIFKFPNFCENLNFSIFLLLLLYWLFYLKRLQSNQSKINKNKLLNYLWNIHIHYSGFSKVQCNQNRDGKCFRIYFHSLITLEPLMYLCPYFFYLSLVLYFFDIRSLLHFLKLKVFNIILES